MIAGSPGTASSLAPAVLAAIGIYGVVAASVASRTAENGVRTPLGAPRARIGAAIGLLVAAASSRVLASLLFDVSRLDSTTYLGVLPLLLGACALACALPARRALRIDPAVARRA